MRYTIKTSGLMCGHCDATVETALLNVAGVTDADADHETQTVQVECADTVTAEQLAAAVEGAGEKWREVPRPVRNRRVTTHAHPDQKRGPAMMADHKSVTRMLKTARGQIDGILRMVEEDRYCVDISTQLMATQALIARINADVLKAHIEGCVTSAIESGDEDLKAAKLAEIERVVDKLSK